MTTEQGKKEPLAREENNAEEAAAQVAYHAAQTPVAEAQAGMQTSLPVLLSLVALLLAAYAVFMAQQGRDQQAMKIETMLSHIAVLETQSNKLTSRMDQRDLEKSAMVRNELHAIAVTLQRIAPLANGEEQTKIASLQQLLGK